MATHRSYVKVVDYSGSPVQNLYVEIRIGWGWPGGRTDRNGVATIDHDSSGNASIKIDRRSVGTMHVPGTTTIQV